MNLFNHKVNLLPAKDVIWRLSNTELMGHDRFKIYQHAHISIKSVKPKSLIPCQRYVLKRELDKVNTLWAHCIAYHGINIFGLNGGLRFYRGMSIFHTLPPIVEDGILNDGMHRVFTARQKGYRRINVLWVEGVPSEYPYYAKPLPGGWKDVEEHETLPEGFKKKEYVDPENYKALFRDFNEIFPGIQEKR